MNKFQRKQYYSKNPLEYETDVSILANEFFKERLCSYVMARKVAKFTLEHWHLFENAEPSIDEQLAAVMSRAKSNLNVLQKAMLK